MQKFTSLEKFVQGLLDRRVLAPAVFDPILAQITKGEVLPTTEAFAEALVAAGLLTPFQVDRLQSKNSSILDLGHYQVIDRLGSGGMGTVYLARHRWMNRVVAIKMMTTESSRKHGFLRRFEREVQTLAQLNHPNIVMAFDAGEWNGRPFLVMEFVKGCDLATEVAERGRLSVAATVDIAIQAASGLAYAHDRGLVHRDVKPANFLLEPGGTVKVADLGIARANDAEPVEPELALTHAGDFVGSAPFSAPEQALDATNVDGRADQYALGCSIFYLLTGRPPYLHQSLVGLLLLHRDAPVPHLSDFRPDIPRELDEIVYKLISKSPGDRYESMAELASVFEDLRKSVELSQDRPELEKAAASSHLSETQARTEAFIPGKDTVAKARSSEPERPNAYQTTEQHRAERLAKISVVLVEPSRFQARLVRSYFEKLGISQIRATDSGREAIEIVNDVGPDVLVCAMHLSDMTGSELARKLSEKPDTAKIGVVLASSEREIRVDESVADLPRALILPKPFSLEEFAQSLSLASLLT